MEREGDSEGGSEGEIGERIEEVSEGGMERKRNG